MKTLLALKALLAMVPSSLNYWSWLCQSLITHCLHQNPCIYAGIPNHKVRRYLNYKGQLAYIVMYSNIKIPWQTGMLDTTDWFQFRNCWERYTAVILTDSIWNSFDLINWSLAAQHPSMSYQYLGIRRSDSAYHMLPEYWDGALLQSAFEGGTNEHCHFFVDSGTDW